MTAHDQADGPAPDAEPGGQAPADPAEHAVHVERRRGRSGRRRPSGGRVPVTGPGGPGGWAPGRAGAFGIVRCPNPCTGPRVPAMGDNPDPGRRGRSRDPGSSRLRTWPGTGPQWDHDHHRGDPTRRGTARAAPDPPDAPYAAPQQPPAGWSPAWAAASPNGSTSTSPSSGSPSWSPPACGASVSPVYLAMWALVPIDGRPRRATVGARGRRAPSGPPWLTYVLLTGALFLGLVFSSSWWGGPRWGGGLAVLWLLVLFAVVVVALRRPAASPVGGPGALTLALIVLSLVILATGAFLGAVAMTGVPLTGGIGQQVWQPTRVVPAAARLPHGRRQPDRRPDPRAPRPGHPLGHRVGRRRPAGRRRPPRGGRRRRRPQRHRDRRPTAPRDRRPSPPSPDGPRSSARPPPLVIDAQVGIGQVELQRGGL